MGWFNKGSKVAIDSTTEFVKAGTRLIDECFTTKEEKLAANQKLLETAFQDRLSARGMYVQDSSAQKLLAIAVLIIWLISSVAIGVLVWKIVKSGLEMPEWAYALISSFYTAITMLLRTVYDFFFGSSRSSQIKDVISKR